MFDEQIIPILQQGRDGINMIAKKDLSLLKSFANPPIIAVHIGFLVLCSVASQIPSIQDDPKTIYKKFQKLMYECSQLDYEKFPEERLERMQVYIDLHDLVNEYQVAKKCSNICPALKGFYQWIKSIRLIVPVLQKED